MLPWFAALLLHGVAGSRELQQHATHRIAGGSAAALPFAAYLHLASESCSGTLVAPGVVLTAAHCFAQTLFAPGLPAPAITVNFSTAVPPETWVATDYILHPAYQLVSAAGIGSTHCTPSSGCPTDVAWTAAAPAVCSVYTNDMALVYLPGNSAVTPAQLDLSGAGVAAAFNNLATAAGFGYRPGVSSLNPTAPVLNAVSLQLQSLSACSAARPCTFNQATQLCASSSSGSTCQGDSGGPLLTAASVVLGVVSYASNVSCGSQSGKPTVYTSVAANAAWLSAAVSSSFTASTSPFVVNAVVRLNGVSYDAWMAANACFSAVFVAALVRDAPTSPGPGVSRWQVQIQAVSAAGTTATQITLIAAGFASAAQTPFEATSLVTALNLQPTASAAAPTYLFAAVQSFAGAPVTIALVTTPTAVSNASAAAAFQPQNIIAVPSRCASPGSPGTSSVTSSASGATLVLAIVLPCAAALLILVGVLGFQCYKRARPAEQRSNQQQIPSWQLQRPVYNAPKAAAVALPPRGEPAYAAPWTAAPPSQERRVPRPPRVLPGRSVRIVGLVQDAALNGLVGKVVEAPDAEGVALVEMPDGEQLSFSAENLKVLKPRTAQM